MKKIIFFSIFLSLFLFFPFVYVDAGIISRPPSNLGLVGYWSMDEGRGTKAGDSSGNGYNGILRNGALWSSLGRRGGAISLDGSNDYIEINDNDSLEYRGGNITISAWIKPNQAETDGAHFISKPWTGCGEYNYRLVYNSNKTIDLVIMGSAYATLTSGSATAEKDKWSHVVGTVDSSKNMNLYINGVLVNSAPHYIVGWVAPACGDSNLPLSIGTLYPYGEGWGGVASHAFNGSMDDVRIYNRVLTSTEISKMYSSGTAIKKGVSNSGLVGYWSMDEGRGAKAGDSSGNGNTGTIVGSTWADGKRGKALNVNGTSDYVDITATSALKPATELTVSGWFKADTINCEWNPVVEGGGNLNNGTGYYFGFTSCSNDFIFSVGDGGYVTASQTLSPNVWYHAVGVFSVSGGFVKLYINAQTPVTTNHTKTSITYDGSPVSIGRLDYCCTASHLFDGLIDDVRIYNRALSATEIQALYKQSSATIGTSYENSLTNGLVGLWTMNGKDISGTTLLDKSGTGKNVTLTGSPSPIIGKLGQALKFINGSQSGSFTNISLTNMPYTVSAWLYKFDTSDMSIVGVSGTGIVNATAHYIVRSSKVLFGNYSCDLTGTQTISPNQWYHVVFIMDTSQKQSIYVNGALDAGPTLGCGYYQGSINLLASSCCGGAGTATLDEVRVYNRALSADEVKQLYRMGQ